MTRSARQHQPLVTVTLMVFRPDDTVPVRLTNPTVPDRIASPTDR